MKMGVLGSVTVGDRHVFMSGNEIQAKSQVADLLKSFGWIHILDLVDIISARGAEMDLPYECTSVTLISGMFTKKTLNKKIPEMKISGILWVVSY